MYSCLLFVVFYCQIWMKTDSINLVFLWKYSKWINLFKWNSSSGQKLSHDFSTFQYTDRDLNCHANSNICSTSNCKHMKIHIHFYEYTSAQYWFADGRKITQRNLDMLRSPYVYFMRISILLILLGSWLNWKKINTHIIFLVPNSPKYFQISTYTNCGIKSDWS